MRSAASWIGRGRGDAGEPVAEHPWPPQAHVAVANLVTGHRGGKLTTFRQIAVDAFKAGTALR